MSPLSAYSPRWALPVCARAALRVRGGIGANDEGLMTVAHRIARLRVGGADDGGTVTDFKGEPPDPEVVRATKGG
jgi:hypothetical protein